MCTLSDKSLKAPPITSQHAPTERASVVCPLRKVHPCFNFTSPNITRPRWCPPVAEIRQLQQPNRFHFQTEVSNMQSEQKEQLYKSAAICALAAAPTVATGPRGISLKMNVKHCLRCITETSFLIPNNGHFSCSCWTLCERRHKKNMTHAKYRCICMTEQGQSVLKPPVKNKKKSFLNLNNDLISCPVLK